MAGSTGQVWQRLLATSREKWVCRWIELYERCSWPS